MSTTVKFSLHHNRDLTCRQPRLPVCWLLALLAALPRRRSGRLRGLAGAKPATKGKDCYVLRQQAPLTSDARHRAPPRGEGELTGRPFVGHGIQAAGHAGSGRRPSGNGNFTPLSSLNGVGVCNSSSVFETEDGASGELTSRRASESGGSNSRFPGSSPLHRYGGPIAPVLLQQAAGVPVCQSGASQTRLSGKIQGPGTSPGC